MKLFGKPTKAKTNPRDLDSGGWVDLAECEKLWEYDGIDTYSVKGEALWRSPNGTLIMRWAKSHQVLDTSSGLKLRSVQEWGFDEVTEEFATQVLLTRDAGGFQGQGEAIARRLFPKLFPTERWDPKLKR